MHTKYKHKVILLFSANSVYFEIGRLVPIIIRVYISTPDIRAMSMFRCVKTVDRVSDITWVWEGYRQLLDYIQ